jgi:carboxyl-terminal processing protease
MEEIVKNRTANSKTNRTHKIRAFAIVILSMGIAFYGGLVADRNLPTSFGNAVIPNFLAQPVSDLNDKTLQEIWHVMQRNYVSPKLNVNAAMDGIDKGLVQSLNAAYGDRFSAYFTPQELKYEQSFLKGSFGGIGATLNFKDSKLIVGAILPGTPAEMSGLKVGDVIIKINGNSTEGYTVEQAVELVRGAPGTKVMLGIISGTQNKELTITRQQVVVPSVTAKNLPGKILYVRLYQFGQNTPDEFHKALVKGKKDGDTKVILDLRDNPGGYVTAADAVAAEFIKTGTIVYLVGRNPQPDYHFANGLGIDYSDTMMVLVNENSASAAEIVSGALKDHKRAKLVGVTTFGKGSAQVDFPLSNGGDLHLTVDHWFTPSGHSIEKNGVTPDISVKLDDPNNQYNIQSSLSDPLKDAQLQAALKALQ